MRIPKLSGTRDRQHYVFRAYLLPWTTDEKVWTARRGSVFNPNIRNVAVERHFYKLQELTQEDITFLSRVAVDGAPKYVQDRCETLVATFTLPFRTKKLIEPTNPELIEISSFLDERIINHEEELHCDVEEGLLPALAEMLKGKTDFYSDDDQAQEFLHAICLQYMRSKKQREALRALTEIQFAGADVTRFGNLLSLMVALRLADGLYRDRAKFKIALLDNQTSIPFITGDQPIINIHATLGLDIPERLEFFYPLSPQKAMLLLERSTEATSVVRADEVRRFNDLIIQNSHEQVFSNSRDCLEIRSS